MQTYIIHNIRYGEKIKLDILRAQSSAQVRCAEAHVRALVYVCVERRLLVLSGKKYFFENGCIMGIVTFDVHARYVRGCNCL